MTRPAPSPRLLLDDTEDDTSRRQALDAIVGGLNPQQLEAVCSDAAVLRILAGAGSGKTRVLTRRIARRIEVDEVDPRRVLAVTFTRKAAAELRDRLGRLGLRGGVNAGTFHAVALTQLRQRWEERRVAPPELLDRKVGFVARLARSKTSTEPLAIVGEIEWAKARMISAADYPEAATRADRRPGADLDRVATVFAAYEQAKLAKRLVDFDDLLRLAVRDLEADPAYAAARRWRFRHLFVDEFQDVNPLQFRLLRAWVGDEPDLCVVGDPNQAIYGWNGADASYLEHLGDQFPGVRTVELTANYRSSPQILGLANAVLSQTSARSFVLQPQRGEGPVPRVRVFEDETTEARAIARMCRDRHAPGSPWNAQAVLVRTNAQLVALEEAFVAAGIPHRSRGGSNLLDQPEVRDALRAMRGARLDAAIDDLDRSLDRVGGAPTGADSAEDRRLVDPEVMDLRDGDAGAGPGLDPERIANLAELVRLGREFLALSPDGTVPELTAWARAALADGAGKGPSDAVDLSTFHAAKGLEWDVVTIAGLEDGLVPISHARTAEAVAEEHRLLYVALTRAERELVLTRASRRSFGSRSVARRPSPHLETIELALEMLRDATTAPADLTAALAAARSRLGETAGERPAERRARTGRRSTVGPTDQPLLEELRRWRLDLSRAHGVPAYVVFNDATLESIAAARPRNRAELLDLPGIGAVKAERFGDDVLRIVAGPDRHENGLRKTE